MDSDLEKENLFKASNILAEIWSNTVIDGHAVDCQAVRLDQEFIPAEESASWISRHVQQGRYAIQVVKCFGDECCQPFETNWLTGLCQQETAVHKYRMKGIEAVEPAGYFRNPKLPFAPLTQRILTKVQPIAAEQFLSTPFDLYYPAMEKKFQKGTFPACASYWPSQAAMLRHQKCHQP